MTIEQLREKIHTTASSFDGHSTHGSVEALLRLFLEETYCEECNEPYCEVCGQSECECV